MAFHLEVHSGFGAGRHAFSYPKFRGGFQLDYVGFWMDYSRFELGLSEKRANWLIKFVEDLRNDGWLTNVKQYQEFHGRLGFATQVLPWLKRYRVQQL